MHILKFALILLEVVLLFNLLIIVHEIGHFLAARWRGLVVEKFGIWFGKPLWKKTINGVEYSLGSIPAGGFVALPQMAPMEAIEGKSETPRQVLPAVSPLDKIIVAFAGPLFSFGLAAVFAVVVWLAGKPVSEGEATTTVGYVIEGGPADRAGILPGDRILEVNGARVTQFGGMNDSVTWHVVSSEGETIPFLIERDGVEKRIDIPTTSSESRDWWRRKSLRQVQIVPQTTPIVASVMPGSAAEAAGLLPNDRIIAADGKTLHHYLQLDSIRSKAGAAPVELTIMRNGSETHVSLPPPAPIVESVMPDSPAQKAGIQPGDRITEVGGHVATSWKGISAIVKANLGSDITLRLTRDGTETEATLRPLLAEYPDGHRKPLLGIGWAQDIVWDQWGAGGVLHPGPVKQLRDSLRTIVNTLGAVISPRSEVTLQHLSGPVGIMRIYYMMFESNEGWRLALWFSVVLNVNLAVLNLLPLPVLDGGHITIALLEWIRRRPVNIRVLEVIQTGCAMLLIGFMLYVTFYDVGDLAGDKAKVKFIDPASESSSSPMVPATEEP